MDTNVNLANLSIPISMKEMLQTKASFDEYRECLLEKIRSREPGIAPNSYERVMPELYIDNPIQSVPLDKIENLPPQAAVTKRGLESFAKEGIEPGKGTFHGARLNRHVDIPIALVKNDDDTFSITDGMHRAVQAFISGEKTILAFVDGGHGPTLKNIFDTFKQEAVKN
jgi:hypothetical protein